MRSSSLAIFSSAAVIVEHEDDNVRPKTSHGADVICGQLMGAFAGDQLDRERPGLPCGRPHCAHPHRSVSTAIRRGLTPVSTIPRVSRNLLRILGTSNGSATPKSLALLRVPTPAAKFSRWAAKKRESREIGVSGRLRATRLQERLVDPERSRPASRSDAQRDTAPNIGPSATSFRRVFDRHPGGSCLAISIGGEARSDADACRISSRD